MTVATKRKIIPYLCLVICFSIRQSIHAKTIIVDKSGNGQYTSIQLALNDAVAGDTVLVKQDSIPYFEKINFINSGDSLNGYISLMAYPGDHPILDGTGVANNPASYTDDIIYISNKNYIRVSGFILRNVNTNEGSGIRVYGYGSHIELTNNEIYNILGGAEDGGAMGITIYGSNDSKPISNIIIDNNFIHDCQPAWSEALTLNGNIENFQVTHNTVQDVNNIGIDFIGGETWLSNRVARNGLCAWNKVYRANSSYGDGYAAGIYVDGGKNILVENNIVSGSDIGMEIGAENQGIVTSGITVRDNLLYKNEKAGLAFGGYASNTGRVNHCQFYSNTLFENDVLKRGNGELWIQYADSNIVEDNIFCANSQNIVLSSWQGNENNSLDYNLWYSPSNSIFTWNGKDLYGLSNYRSYTGQGTNSLSSNPNFINTDSSDFNLSSTSPAINSGNPNYQISSGELDLSGNSRVNEKVIDLGAFEFSTINSIENRDDNLPQQFKIFPAYPNPFNGGTAVTVEVPSGLSSANVNLAVYDMLGRKVKSIFNGTMSQGKHKFEWYGNDKNENAVTSGVYFLVLNNQNVTKTTKVILLK